MRIIQLSVSCLLIVVSLSAATRADMIFEDDFGRPDGSVGNGWTTFRGSNIGNPNIKLLGGQLQTVGLGGGGGGVFRTLPLDLSSPIEFSFDFRTLNVRPDFNPNLPFNDGGWQLFLNANTSANPSINFSPAQFRLIHVAGSRNMQRGYFDGTGMVFDSIPGLAEPIPGQRDYSAGIFSHIEGIVNPDLSTTVRVYYNDGQSPTSVAFSFGAPAGPFGKAPGASLILMNANASFGPHFFDNLEIRTPSAVPEPSSIVLLASGLAFVLVRYRREAQRKLQSLALRS